MLVGIGNHQLHIHCTGEGSPAVVFESGLGGSSLGDRAGAETSIDIAVGVVGLIVVLEATRRTIGWVLPVLAGAFLVYAYFGSSLPDWLLPHRGYGVDALPIR